jgi:prevent-host-death family protein
MESIGVRELRQHASRWLARVAAGESFTITDRGRPVASLGPVPRSEWEQLVAGGAVIEAEHPLRVAEPLEPTGEVSLSDLLASDRDES